MSHEQRHEYTGRTKKEQADFTTLIDNHVRNLLIDQAEMLRIDLNGMRMSRTYCHDAIVSCEAQGRVDKALSKDQRKKLECQLVENRSKYARIVARILTIEAQLQEIHAVCSKDTDSGRFIRANLANW